MTAPPTATNPTAEPEDDFGAAEARPRPNASPQAGGSRTLGVAGCVGLMGVTVVWEHLTDPTRLPLFLFFLVLSLLTVLLPASGPRGQRVGLIPAVGLAALLLLPPLAALLPLLLANTAYAFSKEMPLIRRNAYERSVSLLLAVLAGGELHMLLTGTRPSRSLSLVAELLLVTSVYLGVYVLGRFFGLSRHLRDERTVRRHAWRNWRLEAVSLALTSPIAVLMALAYPMFGLLGVGGATVLLALMLVVAHFGFEVALLRDQVKAMENLSAVSVSQTSAPKVIDLFLKLSGRLVSSDRTALWLTDDSHTRLERKAGPEASLETVSVRFGEGLVGRVAERRKPLLVRDGAQDPRLATVEQGRPATPFSMLLLPLVAGAETMGVAQFERDAPGGFTRRDLLRVRALANQAAATLANVRSHQDVYNQAVTDGLTGLYNRRHMQSVLLDERRRAQRYSHPLSVIMLDVDGFKSYNDTYGHVQGDVLLKMLAAVLQESIRNVDILGRYGGEEFIIVLPVTPSAEAYHTAERLRLAVAHTVFPGFADDPELAVFKTISLGVATFPDVTEDTQELVTLADNALYRAKRGGRNQTVLAEREMVMEEEAAD